LQAWPGLASLILCLAACTEASAPVLDAATLGEARDVRVAIPLTLAPGETVLLQARICRPAGDAPARLVTINHGSPPDAAARPGMQLGRCEDEASRWFLARGYVVAYALRRGYGATGGAWAEDNGPCDRVDYVHAGLASVRDMSAVVDALTALPFVRPDGAIVVGQSAGGWGAIAYDSVPHPKVAAFVVMAGGRGGHHHDLPFNNCRADLLAAAAGRYGTTATTPMLWVYAANDSFFPPPVATALYAAFTAAGGHAEFRQPGPYGTDGHRLFFGAGGSAVWGPMVEQYLAHQLGPAG
jgi:dienelactone hydrolase